MRALLIAPHADDETLFAAYLAQQYSAHIAVVYDEHREQELSQATAWLGCTYTQLHVPKGETDPEIIETYLNGMHDPAGIDEWDLVIIPRWHQNGHEEHNAVCLAAESAFAHSESIHYLTYGPRGERDRSHKDVPPEPDQIARKLGALSCYRSQIADAQTRPWFYELLDMREWIA